MAIVAFPYQLTTATQRTVRRSVLTDYAMDGTPWSRVMGASRIALNCSISGLTRIDVTAIIRFFNDNKMNLVQLRHGFVDVYICQIIEDLNVSPDGGNLYSVTFQAIESTDSL